ncbi:MAG TPA: glycosyltransferase family 4 protein [Solirubrobacterales bacterium]|jgi:glycosyltransferase involved in cell wall biosynthesis|nr:glycosyltransferase family 4 protein [Solirubrobacterales bacterium]
MRVLQLLCQLNLDSHCGTPAHVVELSEALTRAGVDVTLVAGRGEDRGRARQIDRSGIRLVEFEYEDLASFSASLRKRSALMRGLTNALEAALPLVASEPAPVLHAHDLPHGPWIAEVIDRHARTPFLTTSHGADLEQAVGDAGYQRLLTRNRYGSHLIGVGPHLQPQLERYAKGSRVGYIPGGVDAQRAAGPTRPERGARSGLLYVGRLAPEKGVLELPEIFARVCEELPDKHLTIAGDGPLKELLTQRLAARGLDQRARMLGWLPEERVTALMHTAEVLVFPSRWPEPFARTLLKAAVAGLPTVTRDLGGNAEILGEGYPGLLPASATSADLATAVKATLGSAEKRASATESARLRATERFGWDAIASSYLDLYEECLEGCPS